MLASVKPLEAPMFVEDTYAKRLGEAKQEWLAKEQPKAQKIQQAIQKWNVDHRDNQLKTKDLLTQLVEAGVLTREDLKDQWGTPFGISALDPSNERLPEKLPRDHSESIAI
jgi:hypothetical protein